MGKIEKNNSFHTDKRWGKMNIHPCLSVWKSTIGFIYTKFRKEDYLAQMWWDWVVKEIVNCGCVGK
ncbi:MAG: hypothetical protein Pg6B_05820 [Candidatus Azobacteroides pseudotrichonymphae]|nr:MAG: hypothetical protein Pg6B_05820 [Candidatus Azobacteroides pseudotrichonymphae]